MIQFDLRIFFKWVETQPPTRDVSLEERSPAILARKRDLWWSQPTPFEWLKSWPSTMGDKVLSRIESFLSHTIYVWNIYLHEWSIFIIDVGIYIIHGKSAGSLFGMVKSDPFKWLASWLGIKRPRIESPGYMDAISFDPFSCSAVFLFESEVGNAIFHHFFNQQKNHKILSFIGAGWENCAVFSLILSPESNTVILLMAEIGVKTSWGW